MKKLIILLAGGFITIGIFSQSPERLSYQAVVRNSDNQLILNKTIGIQISILQGSVTGTAVYIETHTSATNAYGLINLEIGSGTTSYDFSSIDWAKGPYFIKTAIDPDGGSGYYTVGTTQILSVPYALHAKTAESVTGTYSEQDPVFTKSVVSNITKDDINNWNYKLDNYSETDPAFGSSVASGITGTDTSNWNNKLNSYIETDPFFNVSPAKNITASDIDHLSMLSGINTGDQDLSRLASINALGDSVAQVRKEIPDISGFISIETDPVYNGSVASGITQTDITYWNNKPDDFTETQNLADVAALNNIVNAQLKNVTDPTDPQDAVTKSYVTLRVSTYGDTLFLGNQQWVIIPNISAANRVANNFIKDGDGNTYQYVTIGSQEWLTENLKTTRYNDSTIIPLITGYSEWIDLTTPGFCWYNNDQALYGNVYGALYNWYAVNTGKLCPAGWHIPTDEEWTILIDYLGGSSVAGGKLKETDTIHWDYPNEGATNETGFTAFPGGNRNNSNGYFNNHGYYGFWWSSSQRASSTAWYRYMTYYYANVYRYYVSMKNGFSVRCLKD